MLHKFHKKICCRLHICNISLSKTINLQQTDLFCSSQHQQCEVKHFKRTYHLYYGLTNCVMFAKCYLFGRFGSGSGQTSSSILGFKRPSLLWKCIHAVSSCSTGYINGLESNFRRFSVIKRWKRDRNSEMCLFSIDL